MRSNRREGLIASGWPVGSKSGPTSAKVRVARGRSLDLDGERRQFCFSRTEGVPMLAMYRTVELPAESDGTGKKEIFYVLQGTGSIFVLLGQNGSSLRSFGDTPFNFPNQNPGRFLLWRRHVRKTESSFIFNRV